MNMNIDIEFIQRISERLEGFKRKRHDLYNFRCPLCGDSQKYKAKRRGFFYAHFGTMKFKCHNCGVSESLAEFIRRLDEPLYADLLQNRIAEGADNGGSLQRLSER
jgi:hypothetical protein